MRETVFIIGITALTMASAPPPAAAEPAYSPVSQQSQYVPPKPKKGFRYPDCFCTDSAGKRIEMGQTTCLKIGSQTFTAKCSMSLNNPTWRRVADGCPSV